MERQFSHMSQEVQVYEQRNKDHASRLKKNIDEVCAFNIKSIMIWRILLVVDENLQMTL